MCTTIYIYIIYTYFIQRDLIDYPIKQMISYNNFLLKERNTEYIC